MRYRFIILITFAVLLCRCGLPDSAEYYVTAGNAEAGVYPFNLDMADSTASYDVFFYTRVDGGRGGGLCLDVKWTSPSGKTFSETVYMNSGDSKGIKECYRSGLEPVEPGVWKLEIKPAGSLPGLRGMGVICNRNGTR